MRQRRLMNQINVVPYIDVMLVLLVIFMATAPMIQTGTVDLPRVGEGPPPPQEALYVVVKPDGKLALKENSGAPERLMSNAELRHALEAAIERNPAQSAIVSADKSVIYEKVTDTLDGLRQAGFQKVGLEIKTGTGGR